MSGTDPKGYLKKKDTSNFTIDAGSGKEYEAPIKPGFRVGQCVYYQVTNGKTAEIIAPADPPCPGQP
jgi:hypothetical protein